jgi:hypothetical protein
MTSNRVGYPKLTSIAGRRIQPFKGAGGDQLPDECGTAAMRFGETRPVGRAPKSRHVAEERDAKGASRLG